MIIFLRNHMWLNVSQKGPLLYKIPTHVRLSVSALESATSIHFTDLKTGCCKDCRKTSAALK